MSELRPFIPPQAPAAAAAPSSAPSFPRSSEAAHTPSTNRAFVPPPLSNPEPEVDLQAMLDAAQREVDALQAQSATQSQALEQEKSKFHGTVSVLEQSRAKACRVLAKDAVMLAIEIAHALAGKAFEVDHTQLIALMETCLQEFSSEHPVQVRVSPPDAPHVQAHLQEEGAHSVQVHADPSLNAGDLAVEAEQLVIDSRLVERVATLREELSATVRADEELEPDPEGEEASDEAPQ